MAFFGPTATDICIVRGDSPVIPIVITDNAGAAIDVTGGTFILTVDPSDEPTDASGNIFSVVGILSDPTNGRVTFQPTIANTAVTPSGYFYDVEMTLNGSVRTILKGAFEIQQDISK